MFGMPSKDVSISFLTYEAESPKPRFKLSGRLLGFILNWVCCILVCPVILEFGVSGLYCELEGAWNYGLVKD
jgi:hypothetical protein